MKIGIIGAGNVGTGIGKHLAAKGMRLLSAFLHERLWCAHCFGAGPGQTVINKKTGSDMKIAIIGSGNVGGALAKALRRAKPVPRMGPDFAYTLQREI